MIGADYYNDHDPGAAAWLEALAAESEIPAGTVDSRSILDVRADDLSGFRRVHFFAGIGGWAEALRIARWPADIPVWTGSPPCQPFSVAGKLAARDDERHLAPHFAQLVRAGRPLLLFGEQVASAEVLGKVSKAADRQAAAAPAWAWGDDLQDRLEGAGYAYGAADLCSAGIGAPHIRQRLFFGAFRRDALGFIRERLADHYGHGWSEAGGGFTATRHDGAFGDGAAGGLVDGQRARLEGLGGDGDRRGEPGRIDQIPNRPAAATGAAGGLDDAQRLGRQAGRRDHKSDDRLVSGPDGSGGGMADANRGQCDGVADGERCQRHGTAPGRNEGDGLSAAGSQSGIGHNRPSPLHNFWADADWLFCRDERWRPVEPGTFPLAHRVSGRVGLLRGYGNAINPWLAAAFIEAFARSIIDIGGGNA